MDQKRLILLFNEFQRAYNSAQWAAQRATLRVLLFCLYALIESKGPTQGFVAQFGQGFDQAISPSSAP